MTIRYPVAPPTLADVAERAGVSRQTVSNAINNPDLLRADTLTRVQEAIEELGYSPNRAARNLRTRASHLIGLKFSPAQEGTANAAMDRFVHSLVETAGGAGYHILLFAVGEDEDHLRGYDDLLRSTAVDAFIVTDTYLGNPQAAWLRQRRAPFVAFGRPWDDESADHPWVDVDGAAGVDLATTHLLERGHERIAWIGWRKDSRIGEDRRSGWTRAMHGRHLSTTGLASRTEDTVSSGREAAAVLLDEAQPSAFVCASDTLAMGVLHTLRDRGQEPRPRHLGGRLRRLPGGPGHRARPHLGAPAARGGGRRDRPRPRGPARPPARRVSRRPADADAGGPRDWLTAVRTGYPVDRVSLPFGVVATTPIRQQRRQSFARSRVTRR